MKIDNKTVILVGVIIIGLGALYTHYNDLALAVVSGLVGYLSKETVDYIDNSNQGNQNNN